MLTQANNLAKMQQKEEKIQQILRKGLKLISKFFDSNTINEIEIKIDNITNMSQAIQEVSDFVFILIRKIQVLTHICSNQYSSSQYYALERNLQKMEAEIRTHISLEQQLKIFIESLQEQVDQAKAELRTEKKRFELLYDNSKILEREKRNLQKKLMFEEIKYKVDRKVDISTYKHSKVASLHHDKSTNSESVYLQRKKVYNKNYVKSKGNCKKITNELNRNKLNTEINISSINIQPLEKISKKVQIGKDNIMIEPKRRFTQLADNISQNNKTQELKFILKKKDTRSNSVCS